MKESKIQVEMSSANRLEPDFQRNEKNWGNRTRPLIENPTLR